MITLIPREVSSVNENSMILDDRQKIISMLTAARIEKGISQQELADRIGTKRSNICRIESGAQNISLDMLLKISKALGKDVSLSLEERSAPIVDKYSLRLYDEELLTFSLQDAGLAGMKAHILSVKEERKEVFPLDLDLTDESVMKWLEKRVIPKNRAFVDEILKTLGLSVNNTKGIIDVCKGLSGLHRCRAEPRGLHHFAGADHPGHAPQGLALSSG